MNIIVVVTNYEDMSVISSRRWRYLSRYLLENGFGVTVISHDGKGTDRALNEDGITWLQLAGDKTDSHALSSTLNRKNIRGWTLLRLFYYISRGTIGNVRLICGIKKGILSNLKHRKYDVLISSVYNMDGFYIGRYLRRKLHIPVHICDIRDPLISPFFSNKASQIMGKVNANIIFKEVNEILTVSAPVVEDLRSVRIKRKIHIIPHAFLKYEVSESIQTSKFKIGFFGTFYYENYDISAFVKAIKLLIDKGTVTKDDFSIIVAGRNTSRFRDEFKKYGIDYIVEDKGFLSHEEVLKLERDVDVLLFINNIDIVGKYAGTLGKFPEYLSLDKEILMLFKVDYKAKKQLKYFQRLNVGLAADMTDGRSSDVISDWVWEKIKEKEKIGKPVHNPDYVMVGEFKIDHAGYKLKKILLSLNYKKGKKQ